VVSVTGGVAVQEADRLREAFKKDEFRQLFKDYVDDLANPDYSQEQEAYLSQMEAENNVPKNIKLLRPEVCLTRVLYTCVVSLVFQVVSALLCVLQAGFCLKTHDGSGDKVFINVCHSSDVTEATCTTNDKGQHWSIPNNIGAPRMEKDKSGAACLTFDVCVHTATLARAGSHKAFKEMLCKVCDA
jgi:hypothetical protein